MLVQHDSDRLRIQEKLTQVGAFLYPTYVDRYAPPSDTNVSLIHLLFDDGEYVCLPYNHLDSKNILPISFEHAREIRGFHYRDLACITRAPNIHDLESIAFLTNTPIDEVESFYPPMVKDLLTLQFKKIALAVPLVRWMEIAQAYLTRLQAAWNALSAGCIHSEPYRFYHSTVLPVFTALEEPGLHVDLPKFESVFGQHRRRYVQNGKIHSRYYPFFVTGRPSNSNGGINFAALSKTDDSRSVFTSRFGDRGVLVQFDYEAFHLRILAHILKFPVPETSLHRYLAEQYWGKTDLTEDQYVHSKNVTFSLIYGYVDDVPDIPFLKRIFDFRRKMEQFIDEHGYILTPLARRKIVADDANRNKLFNYFMLSAESEYAVVRIQALLQYLSSHQLKTVPVLYTYDALVLDVPARELRLLSQMQDVLQEGGFPVRRYAGADYKNLLLQKT